MFANWSPECVAVAERVRPILCQKDIVFYPVDVPRQVRAGWLNGKKSQLVATLTCKADGVELTLRVGRDSGFISQSGPLHPSNSKGPNEEDVGKITLNDDLPEELDVWVAEAIRYSSNFFGRQLEW